MSAVGIEDAELFTRKEAADYLTRRWKQRISAHTLAVMAGKKQGPPYILTGRTVNATYTKDDLDRWAIERFMPGRVVAK